MQLKRIITGIVVMVATLAVIALILVGIAREPSGRNYNGYGAYESTYFKN